jgi:hypothetical protein
MKGIGWKNKLIIAKRSDCSIDVMSRICRNGGEKLLDELFATKAIIPEKVIREIHERNCRCSHLVSYWRLPDDIKSEIFQSLLIRNKYGKIFNYERKMNDFLEYQVYLPDDCWNFMDDVMNIWQEKQPGWSFERNFVELTKPMRTPLDDDYALLTIDRMNGRNLRLLMKLAANPSISDYALLELQMKCPECAIEDVNEIIAKRKSARDEYRRMHA